jgi:hypothetical protein
MFRHKPKHAPVPRKWKSRTSTQQLLDAARTKVASISQRYSYQPTDTTTVFAANQVAASTFLYNAVPSDQDIEALFNPETPGLFIVRQPDSNGRAPDTDTSNMVWPMAHEQPELVERIVQLRVGSRLDEVTRVLVYADTTAMYDKSSPIAIVKFHGAGRRVSKSRDMHEANNVKHALGLVGIDMQPVDIAVHPDAPTCGLLVFHKISGSWVPGGGDAIAT